MASLTPTYDPAGQHWYDELLLGVNGQGEAFLAEIVLGIHATTYSGTDAEQLAVAVAVQVAFQVEHGVQARLYTVERRGQRRFEFTGAANVGIDPQAATIVERVTGRRPDPDPTTEFSLNLITQVHVGQG